MGCHAAPVPVLPWGWRSMWVIAMFDLPTDTPAARKAYASFRRNLLEDGFTMMQYSVYTRHCASIENAEVHMARMGALVPASGEVRFMIITDRQFGRTRVFTGKKRTPMPPPPAQLELF
jgi:CRISPR-associated protein Cas2